MMDIIIALFRERDIRITSTHRDVNSRSNYYQLFKSSVILPPAFFIDVTRNRPNISETYSLPTDWSTITRVYIIIEDVFGTVLTWTLAIIDFESECIFYIHPRWDKSKELSSVQKRIMDTIEETANIFINTFIRPINSFWPCKVCH